MINKMKGGKMKNKFFLGALLSVLMAGLVSAQNSETYGCFGSFGMMGYGYTSIFGFVFWILIIVVLVLLIAWLMKQLKEPRRRR